MNNLTLKYRVHIKGGKWLPQVSGYDINDHTRGYAGNGSAIDAIQIDYTPTSGTGKSKNLRAKYRVSSLNHSYYPYQYDREDTNNQDGYAGSIGKAIDRLQIILT